MKSAQFTLGLLAAAVASHALAQAPAASEAARPATATAASVPCFRMGDIRNHRIADRNTIYLKVGFKDVYKLTAQGSCGAGALPDETLIMSTPGGIDRICRPIDLDLKVRSSGGFVSPCIIREITRLTPEQIAALPKKARP